MIIMGEQTYYRKGTEKGNRARKAIIALLVGVLGFSFLFQGQICQAENNWDNNPIPQDKMKQIEGFQSFWQEGFRFIVSLGENIKKTIKNIIGWIFNNKNIPVSARSWLKGEWRLIKREFRKEVKEMGSDIKKNLFRPFSYFKK